jgi:transposase-like protein
MARYGKAFRERAVARLLPPESSPVDTVALELGVSASTLERWRADALSSAEGKRIWTASARLDISNTRTPTSSSLLQLSQSFWLLQYRRRPLAESKEPTPYTISGLPGV